MRNVLLVLTLVSMLFSTASNAQIVLKNQPSSKPGFESSIEAEPILTPDDDGAFTAEPDDWVRHEPANAKTNAEHNQSTKKPQIQTTLLQTRYSESDLDQHALRIAANCSPLKSSGRKGAAILPFDDSFFVVPINSGSLPPFPANGGKDGIHGIDTNKNCVRDDIEHYIFTQYGAKDQEQLRLYLYEYAIWLNFFLIDGISDRSVQAVSRRSMKVANCLEKYTSYNDSKEARDGLFAHSHNTNLRTQQYFNNMKILSGFVVEGNVGATC